jgi:hypothetical protein
MHPFWRLIRFVVMVFVSGFVISAGALPALSQAGVPVPEDSALYKAFNQLKTQSSYRVIMNMQSNDPRMAQMAASGMGFGTTEKLVQGNTTQVIMHVKMPATDVRGEIDDWEFRAVVKDGRGARLISSAAVPRLLKRTDQMVDMQLAMLEKQSSVAMLHALAEGPLGMVSAAVNGAQMAQGLGALMALKKQAHDMFSWKCEGNVGQSGSKTAAQLTDLRATGDQAIEGTAATAYEFYVKDNGRSQGPIRLLVGKDSGLPLRLEMNDPGGHGSMRMDYTDFNKPAQIEVPDCLGK